MTGRSVEAIYEDLQEVMARTFPDREYSGPVGPDTLLFGDIGLASIEFVVLAEKLEGYYGRKLPFGALLITLRDRGAKDLELGEIVSFLHQQVG
ncbi:hypothetical protein [Zavarzinella formosa]|uniref:hypothetical protein n=1 Tax=Zavarzinella formosa TaxID=360055 RepID=UPI0002FEFDA1|nr:hypothetical protein [Zavarzinella formosa]